MEISEEQEDKIYQLLDNLASDLVSDRKYNHVLKELFSKTSGEWFTVSELNLVNESFEKLISLFDRYEIPKNDAEILIGGNCDDTIGYFIEPTVILTSNPTFKTMKEEIFGPVVTAYVYKDDAYEEILQLCDTTSPYGLTGAILAEDTNIILNSLEKLKYTAGNFYVNDKPTGAVVGQQPFGGSRASGTNDKSGTYINLLKWTSPRAIKVNFVSPIDYRYPFMTE